MGKKFARFAAVLIALVVAVAVAVPAAVSYAASSTTTATLNVTYCQTEARSMLSLINEFRTDEDEAWAWDSSDSEKVYYEDLDELSYSYDLEAIAMQRAAEIAVLFSHTRPNGTSCSTLITGNTVVYSYYGENIAAGYGTAMDTAKEAFETWQEADAAYSGQGHRRNMLSSDYNCVGIACVYYNGYYYWVQEFGYTEDSTAFVETEANDSATTVSVDVSSSLVTVKSYYLGTSSVAVDEGGTGSVNTTATFKVVVTDSSGYSTYPTSGVSVTTSLSWTSSDTSIATVSDGTVTGVSAGSTTIKASAMGGTFTVPVTVSHVYESVVTEPTCTEQGYTTYTCSVCGDSYVDDYTDATGHTAGGAVTENEVAATCTEAGSYDTVVYCTVCGEELSRETTIVAATGHSYESVVTEPTCTEQGYTTYTCTVCGDTYVGDYTDAAGHSYDSGTVTTEPTCTETGVKTYACTVCGETYTETVAATGHTAGEAVVENEVAATCTEDGSYDTVTYCTVCGAELSRETTIVAATGHDYVSAVTTEPTCTEEGVTTYICQNNTSHTYTEAIAALGHTAGEAVTENEVAATCTEDGSYDTVVYCTVCGEELSRETEVIEALGHDYVATETTATCTEPGITTYTCSRCDDTYTETVAEALGHSWDEGAITTEPTCTEEGVLTYTCTRCGDTYTETVAALGHTAGEAVIENEVAATCTEDGSYDTVVYCTACGEELSRETVTVTATGHTLELVAAVAATCTEDGNIAHYECQTCGALFADADATETLSASEVIVAATGHSWDEGAVTTEPTCTEAGVFTYTCQNDASHTYTETIAALGHTWGEGVVTEPTCTEAGYTTYTCTVCGATTTGDEVAALGHTWGEWVTISSPTCTDTGSQQRVCEVCGTVETEDLDATGHSWEDDYTVDVEPTCDTDGSQSIHCSECDAVTDPQTIAALGHSWDEGVVTATAFGSDTGEITYTCTTCGDTYTVAFSYEVISGADQTIEQGSALSATANGALDKLASIEVDGAEVDASEYTLVSGSTVLTLGSEYLSTLELGEHTLRFVYTDGDANTTFTIVAATVEDEGEDDEDADADAETDADSDTETDDATDDATADTDTDADEDADEDDEEIVPATGDPQVLLAATVAAAGAVLVAAGMADRRRRQR